MKDQISLSNALSKYLMPLLVMSVLLSFVAVVLSVVALVQSTGQELEIQVDIENQVQESALETSSYLDLIDISEFESCGSESYPIFFYNDQVRCSQEAGIFSKDFVQTSEIQDEVELISPKANDFIRSPLEISGEAFGWFFEATTSVYLTDQDMNIISSAVVRAEDWTSDEVTPFAGSLMFETVDANGWLIMEQANPSGLPEHDNAIGIPILFASYLFEWPPKVETYNTRYGCEPSNERTIEGHTFCLEISTDGAAGHTYTEYIYFLDDDQEHLSYTFTTRFVSGCGIYEGAAMQRCEQEKADFDPDELFYDYYQSLNE